MCGQSSKRGEKCNKVVVATREKTYRQMVWEDDQQIEIEVARGWEVVKEVNACTNCVEVWNAAVENGTHQNLVNSLK